MEPTKEQLEKAKTGFSKEQIEQYIKDQKRTVSQLDKMHKRMNPNVPKPVTSFLYLTDTLILKQAECHPTKGWRTKRVSDLSEKLKGMEFDFATLILELQKRHGEVIFDEHSNPMVGMVYND